MTDLQNTLESNEELKNAFKEDPVNATKEILKNTPLDWDQWIYRLVVSALGFTIIFITIGILVLIGRDQVNTDADVPTILTSLGSAAIGALAGLLVPSPGRNG